MGLYLHIPFCQAICAYCNFNRGLLDPVLKRRYVDALDREIRQTGADRGTTACRDRQAVSENASADTIFFGGGTPSLLEPEEVRRLIEACRASFAVAPDAEVTLETNPETVDEARLAAVREAGVTRLSFGVQSFDDAELRRLGRIHSAARAAEAVRAARQVGFASVSVDLMLWLPGQSPASWRRTVEKAVALAPDHLSMYLLELYPNAPLKETMARAGWSQSPDDEAADMYLEAIETLGRAGFEQYEISNLARPGQMCRHNVKYWQGGEWHGFGCGAHATVAGRRWRNVASTTGYIEAVEAGRSPRLDERALSSRERREEALFLGLRLSAGVDRTAFAARHGDDPWITHQALLAPARESGLVWSQSNRFGLTPPGMLVANEILANFV